jgi:hypothetical protein
LLFQVLRDDFISLFVRGCWLVSFFFTPIYMLILVFVVSFGPKKGTILTYSTYWYANFHNTFQLLISTIARIVTPEGKERRRVRRSMKHRFQFTIITSRPTIYLLFTFWCFFFFFGEFLLLLTFNYNNLTDLIPSSYFVFIKTHIIFLTDNSNTFLNNVIFYYIIFFTTCSVLFLLNLRYSFNYNFFQHQFILDLIFILINIYLFNIYYVFIIWLFIVVNKVLITKDN